ncbi:hypothetical protein R50073_23060 [Maricurvus nonylphenolicus]|uniref:hypothetical protein n=1 Tax=Maricurvus nonylphenolicus TaxID=1008307 RepID=UPI0036F2C6F7
MNTQPKFLRSFLALGISFFLGGFTPSALANQTPLTSKEIIDNYRDLRASCAKAQGVTRRNCYARLNEATKAYKQAKERMTQTDPNGTLLSSR